MQGLLRVRERDYYVVVSPPEKPASERIVPLLRDLGHARIRDLARMLGISLSTTRKYIKDLEDAGLVKRVYSNDLPYDVVWVGDNGLNTTDA